MKGVLLMNIFTFRPEVKENKEGADTEKAAEQSAEPEELVKEKVSDKAEIYIPHQSTTHFSFFFFSKQVEEKIDENKEKEVAAQ